MTSTAAALADADAWHGHMGWGGGWLMLVFGTLMMTGFVILVLWLVRSAGIGGSAQGLEEDPLAPARRILAERYARGEVTTEEYRERVDELG